jgi:hypothetical protein
VADTPEILYASELLGAGIVFIVAEVPPRGGSTLKDETTGVLFDELEEDLNMLAILNPPFPVVLPAVLFGAVEVLLKMISSISLCFRFDARFRKTSKTTSKTITAAITIPAIRLAFGPSSVVELGSGLDVVPPGFWACTVPPPPPAGDVPVPTEVSTPAGPVVKLMLIFATEGHRSGNPVEQDANVVHCRKFPVEMVPASARAQSVCPTLKTQHEQTQLPVAVSRMAAVFPVVDVVLFVFSDIILRNSQIC